MEKKMNDIIGTNPHYYYYYYYYYYEYPLIHYIVDIVTIIKE